MLKAVPRRVCEGQGGYKSEGGCVWVIAGALSESIKGLALGEDALYDVSTALPPRASVMQVLSLVMRVLPALCPAVKATD